ncbi:MAG: zf-HC2 domain-containing protein [Lachnospiraceae bacterium]|nr:zf-HC2 domain-containing protein [Lachnospiraceae bacterium]
MNCKEAEKMIPAFLVKQLNNRDLNEFLMHLEDCPECMEELTIQYLVMIGTSLIEEGKSFNLRKALNDLLSDAWKTVQKWKLLVFASYIVELITFVIMAIILIVVIFV